MTGNLREPQTDPLQETMGLSSALPDPLPYILPD